LAKFGIFQILCGGIELLGGLCACLRVVSFTSQVEQHFGILEIGFERIEESDLALDDSLFSQDLFGGLPILPQVGPGRLGFERIETLAQRSDVKDASGARRIWRAAYAIDP
jgi:hypothetical protein